ncbi:hypothetical protein L6452_27995 [Arctium lappa]|uniref:Uncharacterized protein n=1 Tax=Arctium lappa TaxID=4217 RepID=A0ACB8ZW82_ARCLA|nr:hypothetical protein L6452_27995 [Arctium lappa]
MASSRNHLITNYFLFFLIPYAASLSFNLTNIGQVNQNRDIETEGDGAYISGSGVQVTSDEIGDRTGIAGRATYIQPLHLWNNATGELASFATTFSFVIDSRGSTNYGDGLTFFLAEKNSVIATGGAMGLPFNLTTMVALSPFVAVEFDTFWNFQWDPRDSSNRSVGEHVGISINSLASERSQKWLSNVTGGAECQAWVTYDSVSKNLSVSFTGFRNSTVVRQAGLHYIIDLRDVLPERVIFGFSAATELHSRKITLPPNPDPDPLPPNPNPDSLPPNPGPDPVGDKYNNVVFIVGLSAAVTFLAVLAFVLWRKKQKNREDEAEELEFNAEMISEFEMGTGPTRFSYHELAQSTDLRPSIRQAIQVLNSEASLPILPSKMPVASYLSLPISSLHGVVSIVQNQFSSSNDNTDSSKQTATTSSTASSASPSVSLLHSMH